MHPPSHLTTTIATSSSSSGTAKTTSSKADNKTALAASLASLDRIRLRREGLNAAESPASDMRLSHSSRGLDVHTSVRGNTNSSSSSSSYNNNNRTPGDRARDRDYSPLRSAPRRPHKLTALEERWKTAPEQFILTLLANNIIGSGSFIDNRGEYVYNGTICAGPSVLSYQYCASAPPSSSPSHSPPTAKPITLTYAPLDS